MTSFNKLSQSGGGENPPSNNLWIGNVSPDVTDSDLKALCERHGKVDSVTLYPSRNYAFVYFQELEGAKSAKHNLQGHFLRENPLKIEFTKPAKPCKSLWVAGISQSVSKEELEKVFLRFGKIEEFRFTKDRRTAYVDYLRLEDAIQALNSMNGKRIGNDQIRVDFLRSQSSRREQGPAAKEGHGFSRSMAPPDNRWMAQDSLTHYPEPSLVGFKRHQQFLSTQPTGVLLISHPPSVIVEEDMLHNAMILFGEIERIKTFPYRNHAFVEFRSIEEARRAKEGLQGKLFNDPRILIEYSSSEIPGVRGHGEFPIQPVQMNILGLSRPVLPGHNPLLPPALGNRGPDMYNRPPLGPHSNFDPALQGQEFSDLAGGHKRQNLSPGSMMGGPSWRRSSPTPLVGSSPSAGANVTSRAESGAWDVLDSNQHQRESKRSRFDADSQVGLDEPYGLHPLSSIGTSGLLARAAPGGLRHRHAENDWIWRGLITKGGTPVCRARCVPIGEGIGVDIPDVVNCSARTGLDLLSKHYEDAIGFNIVFFLPDSEEDFASYTEFLRFLGSKDRAGVAKFDDGTTLFLVPPSNFLTEVLKVSGPERLYGVVLKFPQLVPGNSTNMGARLNHSQYGNPNKMTSMQTGSSLIHQGEKPLFLDNPRALPDISKLPPKISGPASSSFPAHSIPPPAVASQAGLALTPELIATLTSLLPANNGSSSSQPASLSQTPSMLGPTSNIAAGPETNIAYWNHENQTPDYNSQHLQQLSKQINSEMQHVPQAQAPPIFPNMTAHFYQPVNPYSQFHQSTMGLPHQGAISSKQVAPVIPGRSGPVPVAPEINQQHQQGSFRDVLRGQGIDNRMEASRFYSSSIVQQPAYPVALSSQLHGNGASEPQPYTPMPSELQLTHHSEQLQTAPNGGVHESSETEADKNERYKTTLLFAANLLSRINQPPGNQPGQGAGSR